MFPKNCITLGYQSLTQENKNNKESLLKLLDRIHLPIIVLYEDTYEKLDLPHEITYQKYSNKVNQVFHCGNTPCDIKYVLDCSVIHKHFSILYFSLNHEKLLMNQLNIKIRKINIAKHSFIKIMQLPEHLLLNKEQFNELWKLHPEEKGFIKLFGKLIRIPRWQQVFGNSYFYSGIYHQAIPMNPLLIKYMNWC
jgi:alkylated DNA repair dioxygenase AlkB